MFVNIKNVEMTHQVFQIFLTHFIVESSPKFTKALMVLIIISSMAASTLQQDYYDDCYF